MNVVCPCCLRPLPDAEELIAERAVELRDECDERGFGREGDLVVEQDAAELLGFENPRSLANLRYMGMLAAEKRGRHWYYRIPDLAAHQHHRTTL